MCYDSDNLRLICVSSGYGYEYSEELANQMAYLKEGHREGVELSEALNSAKGFLFGLRKTLGDGMKKVKPKVDKMTNQMQQNIESVSEKIQKEIFDDEIYERANFDASYNEEDHTESGIDATDLLPDESKEPEPIKVERAITNRIKKLKNSPPKNSPNLSPSGVTDSKSGDKRIPPDNQAGESLQCKLLKEPLVDDKQAIDSALIEAFQRLDQNIEVNQETGSKQIDIKSIPRKNHIPDSINRLPTESSDTSDVPTSNDAIVSSPMSAKSNGSWVLVNEESEYGEI
jgi:hypothetical protein